MTRKNFKPFLHENLEFKNKLIDLAREMKTKGEVENNLASAIIYASTSEYLAEHLLEQLRHFVYVGTYYQYAGILFFDDKDNKKYRTLGGTIVKLKNYNFPDKEEIIKLLVNISKCRNNIFHNLAKVGPQEVKKIDEDIKNVQSSSEELFEKINVVYEGLKLILTPKEKEEKKKEEK